MRGKHHRPWKCDSLKPPFQENGHRSPALSGAGVGRGGVFPAKVGMEKLPLQPFGRMESGVCPGQTDLGLGVVRVAVRPEMSSPPGFFWVPVFNCKMKRLECIHLFQLFRFHGSVLLIRFELAFLLFKCSFIFKFLLIVYSKWDPVLSVGERETLPVLRCYHLVVETNYCYTM